MKNNKTAKMGVLVVVLLLAVAFAAVSTTLNIGGTAKVGQNSTDLEENVVFAEGANAAYLNYNGTKSTDANAVVLSADKKSITFTAPTFSNKGDNAELHYKVTNNSTNYDAKLGHVSCTVTGVDGAEVEYVTLTEGTAHDDKVVATGTTTDTENTVKVELAKTYVGDAEASYTTTCTINATGVEK